MKKIFLLILFFSLLIVNISYAAPFFDMVVVSTVTDTYDYAYTLYYPSYSYDPSQMRGISHWWLEINSAHSTIDEDSIYGYSVIGDTVYNWTMEFDEEVGQVGEYTDWVIKWDTPDIDIPKDPGTLIGYFGFHSTQPPTTGDWGGKGGGYFSDGETQIPLSTHGVPIPEPASLSLLGLGMLGLFGFRRKK